MSIHRTKSGPARRITASLRVVAGALAGAVIPALVLAGPAHAESSTIQGGYADLSPSVGAVCAGPNSTVRVYYAYARVTGQEKGGYFTSGGCKHFYPPEGTFRHFHLCNLTINYCGPEYSVTQ